MGDAAVEERRFDLPDFFLLWLIDFFVLMSSALGASASRRLWVRRPCWEEQEGDDRFFL